MKGFLLTLALLVSGAAQAAIDLSPEQCGIQAPNCWDVANDAGANIHIEGITSGGVYVWLNQVEYYAAAPWTATESGLVLTSPTNGTAITLTATWATHVQCFTGGRGAGCRTLVYLTGGTIS